MSWDNIAKSLITISLKNILKNFNFRNTFRDVLLLTRHKRIISYNNYTVTEFFKIVKNAGIETE